jgi:small subunit ribosomal protein S6
MRRYETIYILRPNLGEEEISKVIESTNQIILNEKGSVIELNKWGMKKLAYLIKKENLGYYVYCDYAGTPAAVSEIERKFRIDDSVLKYMTIKTSAAISDDQIQQAIGDVSAREIEAQETEVTEEKDSPEEASQVTEKKETVPEVETETK